MDIDSFDLDTNEPLRRDPPETERLAAWEQVGEGRFRPRRIKGSCVGRELG